MMSNRVSVCRVEFAIQGKNFTMNSIVSKSGASLVFEEHEAAEFAQSLSGKVIDVLVDGIELSASFVREQSGGTVFYGLKFFDLSQPQKKSLDSLLKEKGARAPARRKFPRLEVVSLTDDLAIPIYCLYDYKGENYFLTIVDFTIGGLMVEALKTDAPPNLRVGSEFVFEIFVSDGNHLRGVKGEVVRIIEEVPVGQKEVYNRYGVRLAKMSKNNDERFRNLILEYCLVLKEEGVSQPTAKSKK